MASPFEKGRKDDKNVRKASPWSTSNTIFREEPGDDLFAMPSIDFPIPQPPSSSLRAQYDRIWEGTGLNRDSMFFTPVNQNQGQDQLAVDRSPPPPKGSPFIPSPATQTSRSEATGTHTSAAPDFFLDRNSASKPRNPTPSATQVDVLTDFFSSLLTVPLKNDKEETSNEERRSKDSMRSASTASGGGNKESKLGENVAVATTSTSWSPLTSVTDKYFPNVSRTKNDQRPFAAQVYPKGGIDLDSGSSAPYVEDAFRAAVALQNMWMAPAEPHFSDPTRKDGGPANILPDVVEAFNAKKLGRKETPTTKDVKKMTDFAHANAPEVPVGHIDELIPSTPGSRVLHYSEVACWIGAEHALQHARNNISSVDEVLSKWQIPQSKYAVHAGFDESLIQNGIGHLEQIHVFIFSKGFGNPPQSLLSELGKIFSPFSSILFTESSSYRIPVFKADGSEWDVDEHVRAMSSKFIDRGESAVMPPLVISLSHSDDHSSVPSAFSSQSSGQRGNGKERDKNSSKKGKEKDDRGNDEPNNHNDVNDPDPDPNPPRGGRSRTKQSAPVYFTVHSKIYTQANPNVFQSLKSDGSVIIQTSKDPDAFAKCNVKFTALSFGSQQTTTGTAYKQFHVRVVIDSHRPAARVVTCKPRRTLEYAQDWKETNAQMTNRTAAAELSMSPKATLGLAAQTSATTEKMKRVSGISQQDELGVIWWGFNVNDPKAQREGAEIVDGNLPEVEFEFRGNAEGRIPPNDVDLEVMSYWSAFTGNGGGKRLLKESSSRAMSYSNLCQIVALKVPSNLTNRSDYVATLPVYVGQNNPAPQPIYEDGSAKVAPTIKWNAELSSINRDWTEHSTLELASLRVSVPPPSVGATSTTSQSTSFSSYLNSLIRKMRRAEIQK